MTLSRVLIGLILSLMQEATPQAALYSTRSAQIVLFSEAPIEDIEAVSKKGYAIINPANGDIQFGVLIRTFEFRKSLMKEHFNENYMESDKFPTAKFKGKINTPIDISKDGEYNVVAIGDLEVHGISKRRSLQGSIRVINGKMEVSSDFQVNCQDHQIEIPTLVFKNIAETIKVTLKGTFSAT